MNFAAEMRQSPARERLRWQVLALVFGIGCIAGCSRPLPPQSTVTTFSALANQDELAANPKVGQPVVGRDQITQISVVNALMLGLYDGVTTIGELLQYGDFGVGTLNHLDGELIVLDGHAFQVRGDGSVIKLSSDAVTPFAIVTPFDSVGHCTTSQLQNLTMFDEWLDEQIGHPNKFAAIRAHAIFSSISVRSVPAQHRPYRPLAQVAKDQSVWELKNVRGTLIGIRCPAWVQGLNVPGYHWHFLSDDHKVGGHVLECQAAETTIDYDICNEWLVRLVDSPGFDNADLNKDLKRELHKVESSRGNAEDQK